MKITLNLLLLFANIYCCFAQDHNVNSKINIELYTTDDIYSTPQCFAQGNYFFTPKISSGIYFGYTYNNNVGFGRKSNQYYMGINSRYYALNNTAQLSPYISALFGYHYDVTTASETTLNHKTWLCDYGLYAGLKLKILKPISIFTEVGYGELGIMHLGISYIL